MRNEHCDDVLMLDHVHMIAGVVVHDADCSHNERVANAYTHANGLKR